MQSRRQQLQKRRRWSGTRIAILDRCGLGEPPRGPGPADTAGISAHQIPAAHVDAASQTTPLQHVGCTGRLSRPHPRSQHQVPAADPYLGTWRQSLRWAPDSLPLCAPRPTRLAGQGSPGSTRRRRSSRLRSLPRPPPRRPAIIGCAAQRPAEMSNQSPVLPPRGGGGGSRRDPEEVAREGPCGWAPTRHAPGARRLAG